MSCLHPARFLVLSLTPPTTHRAALSLRCLQVLSCCLTNLGADLTTAPAVAEAATGLVTSLGPPLLAQLRLVGGSPGGQDWRGGAQLLPGFLWLYSGALALHARCAALHPQVGSWLG